MADLTNFVTLLNGEFDNKDQFEKMCKTNSQYPYAKHINTICNSKIENFPKGFKGVFMIEESYYSVQGTTRSSSHLFLFMEESDSEAFHIYSKALLEFNQEGLSDWINYLKTIF